MESNKKRFLLILGVLFLLGVVLVFSLSSGNLIDAPQKINDGKVVSCQAQVELPFKTGDINSASCIKTSKECSRSSLSFASLSIFSITEEFSLRARGQDNLIYATTPKFDLIRLGFNEEKELNFCYPDAYNSIKLELVNSEGGVDSFKVVSV